MTDLEVIQAVAEAGELMPDATKDPALWKHSMKGRMWKIVEAHGIKAKHVINELCDVALAQLETIGAIGEGDTAFAMLDKLIEARKVQSFASLPPRRMVPAPAPKQPIADCVQRWLMDAYKDHLPNPGALDTVRLWMKAAKVYDEKMPEAERLANVTMQAENYAYNREIAHGAPHRMHFANASTDGHALWVHVHEACAAHKHPVPIAERAGVLLTALGVTGTLFKYTGTVEQARAAFDKYMPSVGLIPDTYKATVIADDYKEKVMTDAPPETEELTEALGRGKGEPPVVDVARNWTSLWIRLNELYEAYVTPVGRDAHEYIHDLLDVQSTKDIPGTVSDNEIVINLKAALDARHQLKAKQGDDAPTGTAKETDKPMATEVDTRPLPEAAFVVLFSLYTPGGVEMKYTVRASSGEELDRQVEEYIKRKLESKWTTQRPSAPPMQNAQTGGSSAPAQQQAPAENNDGGTLDCVLIEVGTSYTGGKTTLKFSCNGREHPLTYTKPTGEMVRLLSSVRKLDGTPFTAADINVGNKYPGMWKVNWKRSAPNNEGKQYDNVLSVA